MSDRSRGCGPVLVLALLVGLLGWALWGSHRSTDDPAKSPTPAPGTPSTGSGPTPSGPQRKAARFSVASLNVLGAGHTSGHRDAHGYAPARERLPKAVALLQEHHVSVVGLQELEAPQYRQFLRETQGSWGVSPGMRLGGMAVRNSLAWNRRTWVMEQEQTMPVTYARGNIVPMPAVLLRHRTTGVRIWVLNVHNPATTRKRGDNARWRREAVRRELAAVRRVRGSRQPVILTGDFNSRRDAFCAFTTSGMLSAEGGTRGRPCRPPSSVRIDQIFGTPDLRFGEFRRIDSRGASDHPFVVVKVTAVSRSGERRAADR